MQTPFGYLSINRDPRHTLSIVPGNLNTGQLEMRIISLGLMKHAKYRKISVKNIGRDRKRRGRDLAFQQCHTGFLNHIVY